MNDRLEESSEIEQPPKGSRVGVDPIVSFFEVGRYYKHSAGRMLSIVGSAYTTAYGPTLVGENKRGELSAVGQGPGHTIGWSEINKDEWRS